MRLVLKTFFLSVVMFFTGACFGPSVPNEPETSPVPPRTEEEYAKVRDRYRNDVIENTRTRYSGQIICDELDDRDDRKDCEKISLNIRADTLIYLLDTKKTC